MKHILPFRVIVSAPPSRVAMMVQRDRDELLPPVVASKDELKFEFEIDLDLAGEDPNFLGKYTQGPKNARFVYVNSGTSAGEQHSCWSRRAKLSLMTIRREQVESVIRGKSLLFETTMPGVGKDGGPTCGSVKGVEWTVVKR